MPAIIPVGRQERRENYLSAIRTETSSGRFRPLSPHAVRRMHAAVMRIFEEIGFEVHSPEGLEYFSRAGARVDRDMKLVRVGPELAMQIINRAPSSVKLYGRLKKHNVNLGGKRVYTGTGGTALYIYNAATGDRRSATLEDLKNITRLVEHLDNIHLFLLPTYPGDLPVDRVDVNRFFTGLNQTAKHIMGGVYTLDGLRQVIRMAEIVAGSPEALRNNPIISIIACCISPLRIDGHYGELMIETARQGIPLVCPAEPLCGTTSPVTLAGNLAVQVADSLAGVMLAQLVNPGTPVVFGSVASTSDLNDFKYLTGSVEMGLLNAAGAQMAHFYRLPFYSTGGMTDSKVLDAQCGYESAITSMLCALAGANFIHDSAGLMEFALTACLEKYVIDNEILGMVMRAARGLEVNDETIAFDVIRASGPGGNFVTSPHTRRNMRREHYRPTLSDRAFRENWAGSGAKDTVARASEQVNRILAQKGYSLPDEVKARIREEIPGLEV